MKYFHTGHAVHMLEMSRRTIYRWLKDGFIVSYQTPGRKHLFSLEEINRVRELYGHQPLTETEAQEIWETW